MKIFRFIPVLALALGPGPRLHAEKWWMASWPSSTTRSSRNSRWTNFIAPAIDTLEREYAGQPEAVFQQKLTGVFNDGLEQLVERQLILHDFDTRGLPDARQLSGRTGAGPHPRPFTATA